MNLESSPASAILEAYNKEEFWRPCFASLVVQSLRDIEASLLGRWFKSGDPPEICEKKRRIQISTQENKDVGTVRNARIKETFGKYFFFPNSDKHLFKADIEGER